MQWVVGDRTDAGVACAMYEDFRSDVDQDGVGRRRPRMCKGEKVRQERMLKARNMND